MRNTRRTFGARISDPLRRELVEMLTDRNRRIVIGFLATMLCFNAAVVLIAAKAHHDGRNDFPIFYSNAQMVREGRASGLYDFDAENSFMHRVVGADRPPNNHLPYELLLFLPLTYLQFRAASLVWALLNLAMLVCVALMIRNLYGGRLSLMLLVILAFYPEVYCLLMGQDSIMLLLLFAASLWLWKRGKEGAAGFVLAVGLFRPQLVLPFVLVAFLAGKWKFIRGFIPGAALVIALSAWVVGLHGMGDYARILLAQATEKSASVLADRWEVWPGWMPTWRGLLWLALPTWTPSWMRTLLLLSGTALGLGWSAKKMRAAKDFAAFDMAFATTLAIVLLVSFHSYLNDFGLMILPFLVLGPVLATSPAIPRSSSFLIIVLCSLLFLTPLYLLLSAVGGLGWLFPIESTALWVASRSERVTEKILAGGGLPKAMSIETMQS